MFVDMSSDMVYDMVVTGLTGGFGFRNKPGCMVKEDLGLLTSA